MLKFGNRWTGAGWRALIAFEEPGEGSSGGGSEEGGEGGEGKATGTMFKTEEGDEGGDQGGESGASEGDERPDWLIGKFKTAEEQAKAYSELYRSYSKKTDDLRAEVTEQVREELSSQIPEGVPEDIEGYEYPENVKPPEIEGLDEGLRTWARENNITNEAFQKLINDVWLPTQPNPEAELAKLGDDAEGRLNKLNRWLSKNVDEGMHQSLSRVMQTADGVMLMEHFARLNSQSGFMPEGQGSTSKVKTRDEIREMQADPRYGQNDEYTAMVRAEWKKFAARQPA